MTGKRFLFLSSSLGLGLLLGCGSSPTAVGVTPAPVVPPAARVYNGTASVGDFLTITIRPASSTLDYSNITNGDHAAGVPYTVAADGHSYTIVGDAHLQTAYEVPGVALMVTAHNVGPNHDTDALVTAVQSAPLTPSGLTGLNANYMQFRTNNGGLEIGSIKIDGSGNLYHEGYWPYGAFSSGGPNPGRSFGSDSFPASAITQGTDGTNLKITDSGGVNYCFGTPNGFFAVDTGNGALIALPKAASSAFSASWAGTYRVITFSRKGAQGTPPGGGSEGGVAALGAATMTIDASANITVVDGGGTVASGVLIPVSAAAAGLVGAGKLSDPCNGFFTFHNALNKANQDVYIAFLPGALLFSTFTGHLASTPGNGTSYDYMYGIGLQ